MQIQELSEKEESSKIEDPSKRKMFEGFTSILTFNELRELRSMHNIKDVKFIRQLLQILYKSNVEILERRTGNKATSFKMSITPEKKKIIEDMYIRRTSIVRNKKWRR